MNKQEQLRTMLNTQQDIINSQNRLIKGLKLKNEELNELAEVQKELLYMYTHYKIIKIGKVFIGKEI